MHKASIRRRIQSTATHLAIFLWCLALGTAYGPCALFFFLFLLFNLCQTLGISQVVHSDGQEDVQQDV